MKSFLLTLLMACFLGASLNALSAPRSNWGTAKSDANMGNQRKAHPNGPSSSDRGSAKGTEHEKTMKHKQQRPNKNDKKTATKSDRK